MVLDTLFEEFQGVEDGMPPRQPVLWARQFYALCIGSFESDYLSRLPPSRSSHSKAFAKKFRFILNWLFIFILKRNEGLKKFEIDIGQLVNHEENEEKMRSEKAIEEKELQANKVCVLMKKK